MKMKKILSTILIVAMIASMFTFSIVQTSAAIDPKTGEYVVSEGIIDTQTVYFYMPNEWKNEYTKETGDRVGAYWWTGSDPCGDVAGITEAPAWPGYKIHHEMDTDEGSIFSLTMPIDVGNIVFNNYLDGGEDIEAPQYTKAVQTIGIPCEEYYEPGDSELYDEIYPDENIYFDGMIFVCDKNKYETSSLSSRKLYSGEWYFYYGDGKYGYYKTEEEAVEKKVVHTEAFYTPFLDDEFKIGYGDVDGDGEITVDDVTAVQKSIAGNIELSAEQLAAADVNKDGRVTIDDVTMIQKHIANIIAEF